MQLLIISDPTISYLRESTDQFIKQDTDVEMVFAIEVTNAAASQSGNDIPAATGSDVNFEFLVKFTNCDIRTSTATGMVCAV